MQVSRVLVYCVLLGMSLVPVSSQDRLPAGQNETHRMGQKSKTKCREYGDLVYVKQFVPSLFPDEEPTVTRVRRCGVPDGQGLIVGGEEAQPYEFPHMAALGYQIGSNISWLCGGSLISERYVLTAAHCLGHKEWAHVRWVLLGDYKLGPVTSLRDRQMLSVVKHICHPDFHHPSLYNDIALLKLDRDVKFSKYVRPACLNSQYDVGSTKVVATGWGRTTQTGVGGSEVLMKVTLGVVPVERCILAYNNLIANAQLRTGVRDEKMVCAGVDSGKKDSCSGDSGGPLQTLLKDPDCMHNIVGITSFGSTICGSEKFPAIYTRVSNYIPWIESVVWP